MLKILKDPKFLYNEAEREEGRGLKVLTMNMDMRYGD